jgi:hypothetical protein
MIKKRSNLYLNDQIYFQMIKFKRTNQKLTVHYHPSVPVANGSVNGTTRFGWALTLPSVQTSTSSLKGDTAQ